MSKCGGVRGATPKPACGGVSGWALVSTLALLGCGATVDPLGQLPVGDEAMVGPDSDLLAPLSGPASYPNVFASLLGKSDGEIDAKVNAAFERLFHGDPTDEAIYFTVARPAISLFLSEPVTPPMARSFAKHAGDFAVSALITSPGRDVPVARRSPKRKSS